MAENEKAYQRARTDEHVAEREALILAATRTIMDRDGIEKTSLSAIAREVGLAKSSLYRYYESREEILVVLLLEEADLMIAEFRRKLEGTAETSDLKQIAQLWAAVCFAYPRLCLLVSQLAPILEYNLSVERIVKVKLQFLQRHRIMAGTLSSVVPALTEEGAQAVVQLVFTIIAGLWPMKADRKNTMAALEHPDLAFLKVDFQQSLTNAIEVCMYGILAKGQS